MEDEDSVGVGAAPLSAAQQRRSVSAAATSLILNAALTERDYDGYGDNDDGVPMHGPPPPTPAQKSAWAAGILDWKNGDREPLDAGGRGYPDGKPRVLVAWGSDSDTNRESAMGKKLGTRAGHLTGSTAVRSAVDVLMNATDQDFRGAAKYLTGPPYTVEIDIGKDLKPRDVENKA